LFGPQGVKKLQKTVVISVIYGFCATQYFSIAMHQKSCYVIRRKVILGLDHLTFSRPGLDLEGRPCATGGEAKRKISRETAQEQGTN